MRSGGSVAPLEAVLRVAGHRVEAPGHRAGLGVIGRDVPAHAEVGASVADDHLALHDSGRAADGVVLRLVDGERLPHLLARLRIERDQPAVEGADVDLARPDGDAAVDHVAASLGAVRSGDLRIELPQELAGPGVEGEHVAPGARRVHHAVDHDRRGLHAARGSARDVVRPRETELAHVGRRDLRQRAEALLPIRPSVAQPVLRLLIGGDDSPAIDLRGHHRRRGQHERYDQTGPECTACDRHRDLPMRVHRPKSGVRFSASPGPRCRAAAAPKPHRARPRRWTASSRRGAHP